MFTEIRARRQAAPVMCDLRDRGASSAGVESRRREPARSGRGFHKLFTLKPNEKNQGGVESSGKNSCSKGRYASVLGPSVTSELALASRH